MSRKRTLLRPPQGGSASLRLRREATHNSSIHDDPAAPLVLLTLAEAAARMGCSKATTRRGIENGELPAIAHGRILRLSEVDIAAYLRKSRRWR